MALTVYQTDAAGLYLGPVEADESPLEEGVYLIPAGCVEVAPPEVAAGEVAVWLGDAWSVVPDHRGETWFSAEGAPVVVTAVGDPALAGLTPEPPAPSIEDQVVAAIAAVDAVYRAKFDAIRVDLATATLTDGPGMDAAIAALRAKWADTWTAYGTAVDDAVAAILGD